MKIIRNNGMNRKVGYNKEENTFWYDWATNRGVRKGQFSGAYKAIDFINQDVGLEFFKKLDLQLFALQLVIEDLQKDYVNIHLHIDNDLYYEKLKELRTFERKQEQKIIKRLVNEYIKKYYIKLSGVLKDYRIGE